MQDTVSMQKLRRYIAHQNNLSCVVDVARGDELWDKDESDESTQADEKDTEDLSEVIYLSVTVLQAAYLAKDYARLSDLLQDPNVDPNHVFHDGRSQDIRFDMGGDGIFLEKMTLLHLAVLDGDVEVVRMLCKEKRVNVNARANVVPNKHLFYKYDTYLDTTETVDIDDYDSHGCIADMWISRDVTRIERIGGVTPLHLAFRVGKQSVVDALLEAGADLNAVDSKKDTPLDYLKQSQRDVAQVRGCGCSRCRIPYEIDTDVDSLAKSLDRLPIRRFKPRLLLGEADFSFAAALLKKHEDIRPSLGRVIVATELESSGELYKTYKKFYGNMQYLHNNRATMFFNFDARRIHDDPRLTLSRYPRIHFNCPYHKNPKIEPGSEKILQNIVADFFKSASLKQELGDRIHMALPKDRDPGKRQFREAYLYGIFEASARAGYRLIKKRKFSAQRYPGYEHRKTGADVSVDVTEDSREYVFEKTALSYEQIKAEKPPIRKYVKGTFYNALPEHDTDNDSSSYEAREPALKKSCQGFVP